MVIYQYLSYVGLLQYMSIFRGKPWVRGQRGDALNRGRWSFWTKILLRQSKVFLWQHLIWQEVQVNWWHFNRGHSKLVLQVYLSTGICLFVSNIGFRLTWAEERKRNLETFGVPGRFLGGQGFRGGLAGRRGRGTVQTRSSYRTRNGLQ